MISWNANSYLKKKTALKTPKYHEYQNHKRNQVKKGGHGSVSPGNISSNIIQAQNWSELGLCWQWPCSNRVLAYDHVSMRMSCMIWHVQCTIKPMPLRNTARIDTIMNSYLTPRVHNCKLAWQVRLQWHFHTTTCQGLRNNCSLHTHKTRSKGFFTDTQMIPPEIGNQQRECPQSAHDAITTSLLRQNDVVLT